MPVCTDSCLFAAYIARESGHLKETDLQILDLGSGTGLLSLMLAQKLLQAHFTGLEPHLGSYQDSLKNKDHSPWSHRISFLNLAFQEFGPPSKLDFDWVVANPPFFIDHLPSESVDDKMALHSQKEVLLDWLSFAAACLRPDGVFWLMLEGSAWDKIKASCSGLGLNVEKLCRFSQVKNQNWRVFLKLTKKEGTEIQNEGYSVYASPGILHPHIQEWMADYYLEKHPTKG